MAVSCSVLAKSHSRWEQGAVNHSIYICEGTTVNL